MPIPTSDPRHPLHAMVTPPAPNKFAGRGNPRRCPDCGLLDRHHATCTAAPASEETL